MCQPVTFTDPSRGGEGVIHVAGRLPERHHPWVAIVGARAASRRGMDLAHRLAAELAERGVVVVSGGAMGIDAAAHRGALAGGGLTVAMLASSLDAPYPARNLPLFDQILRAGGALASPFAPGTSLRRWHFPRRNEVMAGFADAVVVVEASAASGSLHTAISARRLHKIVGACPGTTGAQALLAQGAAVVEGADDVLAALAGRARQVEAVLPAAGSDEALALDALDGSAARDLAELVRLSGLGITRLSRALCALELEGLALPVPGGSYVRSAVGQAQG